jgi:3-hydroxy-9,10-secoandrosta-1,3,5(10)-triene-9,17-dione monooxygenase reductase component
MDSRRFREIAGHFASGVTIVTACDPDGEVFGLTASSFTSVSLDPLLVLVCVDRDSGTLPRLLESGAFAVNILSQAGGELARRFAGRDRDGRFAGLEWRPASTGSPVLRDALAWLDCRLWSSVDAGDHQVLFGEVVSGDAGGGRPLIWFRGGFHRLDDGVTER